VEVNATTAGNIHDEAEGMGEHENNDEDDSHGSTLPPLLSDIDPSDEDDDDSSSLDEARVYSLAAARDVGLVPVRPLTTPPPSTHAAPPQDRPTFLPPRGRPTFSDSSSYYSVNDEDDERSWMTTDDGDSEGEPLFYENSFAVAMNYHDANNVDFDSLGESSSVPSFDSNLPEVDATHVPDLAAAEMVVAEDVSDAPASEIEGITDNTIIAAEDERLFAMDNDAELQTERPPEELDEGVQ
jgi:hypothetical protein